MKLNRSQVRRLLLYGYLEGKKFTLKQGHQKGHRKQIFCMNNYFDCMNSGSFTSNSFGNFLPGLHLEDYEDSQSSWQPPEKSPFNYIT